MRSSSRSPEPNLKRHQHLLIIAYQMFQNDRFKFQSDSISLTQSNTIKLFPPPPLSSHQPQNSSDDWDECRLLQSVGSCQFHRHFPFQTSETGSIGTISPAEIKFESNSLPIGVDSADLGLILVSDGRGRVERQTQRLTAAGT